jgi:sulfonate transport system permease protein
MRSTSGSGHDMTVDATRTTSLDTRADTRVVAADRVSDPVAELVQTDQPATGLVRLPPVRVRRRTAPLGALRLLIPAVVLALWWWETATGRADPSVLPSPHRVLDTFWQMAKADLWSNLRTSLGRSVRGAAVGIAIGLVLGGLAGLSRLGERLFDSSMQMLRTVPFLAIVPLLIVWFGIGEEPKLVLIAAATTFPMYLNTYNGVRNVDRKVVEASRSYGLRGPRLVGEIMLPLAMPSILTGLRFSLGVSILALLAAEQINASSGLGYLLYNAQVHQRVDVLMVVVIIYALLGLAVDLLVRLLERFAMPWRAGVSAR